MGVFSFMETFFFISLGITFVLILLLVYHFKQRIITLEQKHDTMFDIVNNIVKQLRNIQMNMQHLGEQHIVQPTIYPDFNMQRVIPNIVPDEMTNGEESGEDESADESMDDSDVESTDDESVQEDESADESEDSDESLENQEPIVVEVITPPEAPLDEVDDEIIIHKSDGSISMIGESTEPVKDMYKKMSISALKSAVKEKGLSSDPSKMKKQELVQLLESAHEK